MKSTYVKDRKIVYKYRLWNEDTPICSILFDVEAYSYAGKPSPKLIKDKACMAGLFLWRDYNKIMFNEVRPGY
jgi:hypothetical protein